MLTGIIDRQKIADTNDNCVQTDKIEPIIITQAPPKAPSGDNSTQTLRKDLPRIKLTAFDTYDLIFVKDLVNNL
jgi:hypothetical protein